MLIRDFASVLNNCAGVPWQEINGCALTNAKVDR
jgi:hypothetical protein